MDSIMGSRSSTNKKRQNGVLSTSFVSTRKLQSDEGVTAVSSTPLQTRKRNNTIVGIKQEMRALESELNKLKLRKAEAERIKLSTSNNDIYQGTYSTEHLQRHSLRLKASTQLRAISKSIKDLEESLTGLKTRAEAIFGPNSSNSGNIHEEIDEFQEIQLHKKRSDLETPKSHSNVDLGSVLEAEKSVEGSSMGKQNELNNDISEIADDYLHYSYFTDEEAHFTDNTLQDFDSGVDEDDDFVMNSQVVQPKSKAKEIATATWHFSNYLQSLQDPNASRRFILTKANNLVVLLSRNPEIKHDMVFSAFSNTILNLLFAEDSLVVSAGYRICRYLITDAQFVQHLVKIKIDTFLVISLSGHNAHDVEREQAIKLVREFVTYGVGINQAIIQAVISCVEKADDKLRNICIETLVEIAILAPQLLQQCNGFRVLENLLHDQNIKISLLVLDTFLSMMNNKDQQMYVEEYCNVSSILSVLSDWHSKSTLNVEKLQNSMYMMARLFKNYNGLIILSKNGFKPLKDLISFLQTPFVARYVLDLIMDIIRIKPLNYTEKNSYGSNYFASHFPNDSLATNQYVVLVVKMLCEAKLVDALSSMLLESRTLEEGGASRNNILFSKARHTLSEFLSIAINIDSWKNTYFKAIHRSLNPSKITEAFLIEKINSKLNKYRTTLGIPYGNAQESILTFSKSFTKSTLLTDVDESNFKKMVYDTRVLQTKDFSQWNWEILSDLCEGPLRNPKRLDELARSTKFVRRLLIFYRPFRYRYSIVNNAAPNAKQYTSVGILFFSMLLSHNEGLKILSDDNKIIPQVASSLYKSMIGQELNANIFTHHALKTTACAGYFSIIGVLMKNRDGVSILERWNVFTVIYMMFQPNVLAEEYLLLILPELDLKYSVHCRIILRKALTDARESIRVSATRILEDMINDCDGSDRDLEEFMLNLLVQQLYDLSAAVVAIADRILYDYCAGKNFSQGLKPAVAACLDQLVFIGSPILFDLLTSTTGFKLLNGIHYVEEERAQWIRYKNREYVNKVEEFLEFELHNMKMLHDFPSSSTSRTLPLHFYECLAKTEEGINLIEKNGDFLMFSSTIKKYIEIDAETPEEIIDFKSSLWCCGFIGSTELGIKFLDAYNVVNDFVEISMKNQNPSIRFSAFYTLGLISRTQEGSELLDELDWDCHVDVRGYPTGICTPRNIVLFLSYPAEQQNEEEKERLAEENLRSLNEFPPLEISQQRFIEQREQLEKDILADNEEFEAMMSAKAKELEALRATDCEVTQFADDPVSARIIKLVGKLGNYILANNAMKELTDLKSNYGAAKFENMEMFYAVFNLMAEYRFKPSIRKFLCDMFIHKKAFENFTRRDKRRRR
ncbi:HHL126Wp [Eremothecium sinecaudum]|uniref:HHL126Wp n=1 Tax=Eremothecium sinecaudum TaxID=45286 RepID=A0A0X8HWC6_9SACH|nr:HHL126Wp [Eremothecium sinecaudum]AMD22644.1 HHL126Wp [Eremothecium sinecaudum]